MVKTLSDIGGVLWAFAPFVVLLIGFGICVDLENR